MLSKRVCHTLLKNSFKNIHQARINSVLDCADALIAGNRLTLTAIGRNLFGKAHTKHKIKRVDRLLGNQKLHHELVSIYSQLSQRCFAGLSQLLVAVDWSGCCSRDYFQLRASLLVDGRSLPIYNLVVQGTEQETEQIHARFLTALSRCLPKGKPVCIITDGGFKAPWFKQVEALGWTYLGRVRGRIHAKLEQEQWQPVSEFYPFASQTPNSLGSGQLSKTSSATRRGYFHLYKGKPKGRHKKRGKHQPLYPDAERAYQKISDEPWLLFTNDATMTARQAVCFYSKRMQIEQNFRDDKSQRYGFAWRYSKTETVDRISVLSLIATIATLVLWLIGFQAERQGVHWRYQANTTRTRRVLSFLTLAKSICLSTTKGFILRLFRRSLKTLTETYDRLMLLGA